MSNEGGGTEGDSEWSAPAWAAIVEKLGSMLFYAIALYVEGTKKAKGKKKWSKVKKGRMGVY